MSDTPAVILGVPIDACSMPGAIERLDELIRLGRKHDCAHQVATVNVDFLVNAVVDRSIHRLLQRAELNLADGMPIVWASRWLRSPLPERVAGADLVHHLAEASEARGWRVHLLGAGPGVADRARSMMLDRHPSAFITADSGPASIDVDSIDDAVVASIRQIDPDVLCVALGNPKQERFIANYRHALRCPVMIGIGGSLDMMVGVRRRAPDWMRRTGTEWIFRAAQEPGRLGRRYLHDIRVFGPALLGYWWRTRPFQRASDVAATLRAQLPMEASSTDPERVDLDLRAVACLDARAHGALIGLLRRSHLQGTPVTIVGVDDRLRACFETYGTWPWVADHIQ
jgi:N-acetylglucosaminyldiphosphoundecaprenol N-acetyl-beta-D-mannosaminyltransferase